MATATAKLSDYRQSPRKVRLVANLIKGKSVTFALAELGGRSKRAAPALAKLIASAVANAKARGLDEHTLIVSEVRVDKGVVLKRFMPRAMGRAARIHKRSSHIMVTLKEKESALPTKKAPVEEKAKTKSPAKKKSVKAKK
jgi:large subunit ribosomal protein L22